ncbi:MAG: hypothetical protein HY760_01935 [Nitrospirae bacterium]|nr:hypothetical protein [Nitrospirota bacterium]
MKWFITSGVILMGMGLFAATVQAAEGEWRIVSLDMDRALPAPGDRVVVTAVLGAEGTPGPSAEITASDVDGRVIARMIFQRTDPETVAVVHLPIPLPSIPGRYNYNVTVQVGPSVRHLNIPISSKPVEEAAFTDLRVVRENGVLRVTVEIENRGNRDLKNLAVVGVINPGIGRLTGMPVQEFRFGPAALPLLRVDGTREVSLDLALPAEELYFLGENGERFYLAAEVVLPEGTRQIVREIGRRGDVFFVQPLHVLGAHGFYTDRAVEIFAPGTPIRDELDRYRDTLVSGSIQEDALPDLVYGELWPFLFVHHFLDYDNHPYHSGLSGTGLYVFGATGTYIESAYEKAEAYWNGWTLNGTRHPGVMELYLGIGLPFPDKITAYEYLGRIAHLIEDMTTPAHTHSDIHGILIDDDEFEEHYEPGTDPATGRPRYEKYDETGVVWAYWRDYIGPRNFLDFAELFTRINNHADYFPSDDYEGDADNFTNPWNIPRLTRNDIVSHDLLGRDFFRRPGMTLLADRISPLNVMSAAAIYRYFWDATHPP